jgi:hypothetical protein
MSEGVREWGLGGSEASERVTAETHNKFFGVFFLAFFSPVLVPVATTALIHSLTHSLTFKLAVYISSHQFSVSASLSVPSCCCATRLLVRWQESQSPPCWCLQ